MLRVYYMQFMSAIKRKQFYAPNLSTMIRSIILTQVYGTKARGFTLMGDWNSGDRCALLPSREMV